MYILAQLKAVFKESLMEVVVAQSRIDFHILSLVYIYMYLVQLTAQLCSINQAVLRAMSSTESKHLYVT